jgi:steroid 5-alpha reductase family enzyme
VLAPAVAVAVLLAAVWVASLLVHDASIVDPAWGPAFVLVALVSALSAGGDPARRWLLLGVVAVWGLRLGAHLALRKRREPGEDRRYARMRARHPGPGRFAVWSLAAVFALQGTLVWVVSLPLQIAAGRRGGLSVAIVPGLVVYAVGLAFEVLGDHQLRRFKASPDSRGRVLDHGLWRYTRHPNYFGDACVWWGLWLLSLQAGGTWWTAVGPAVMTLLLVRVSGKALLERDIAGRRPGYAEYVRRTSGFIPRPPRGSIR